MNPQNQLLSEQIFGGTFNVFSLTLQYSGFQAKWCKPFVVLARLLSHSGCSNPYGNQVWSHNLQLLPIAAIETPVYGHRTL